MARRTDKQQMMREYEAFLEEERAEERRLEKEEEEYWEQKHEWERYEYDMEEERMKEELAKAAEAGYDSYIGCWPENDPLLLW